MTTMSSSLTSIISPLPPKLHLDDGSRLRHLETVKQKEVVLLSSTDNKTETNNNRTKSIRHASTSVTDYYEIDRVSQEIVDFFFLSPSSRQKLESREDGFLCRVALQLPDTLLADAAQVTWEMEEAIGRAWSNRLSHLHTDSETDIVHDVRRTDLPKDHRVAASSTMLPPPLVFVLGDTTYAHCCPDEIGALHLSADILVHYGAEACFSPTEHLPVIYSFGINKDPTLALVHDDESGHSHIWSWNVEECLKQVLANDSTRLHANHSIPDDQEDSFHHIVLLCQPQYHREMNDLRDALLNHKQGLGLNISIASFSSISSQDSRSSDGTYPLFNVGGGAIRIDDSLSWTIQPCSCSGVLGHPGPTNQTHSCRYNPSTPNRLQEEDRFSHRQGNIRIGNLQIPVPPEEFSKCLFLYIGDADCEESPQDINRHFLHVLLRCTPRFYPTNTQESDENAPWIPSQGVKPKACWAYHPKSQQLSTQPLLQHESHLKKFLNRRFYLIQRASLANVIGILVGTLSQKKFRSVISTLQRQIIHSGRACYTLAVGKIHQISKLANFAEIDCFVLVACTETSILPNEREYHVPILTPHELDVALGIRSWDTSLWSCDYFDYLQEEEQNEHTTRPTSESVDAENSSMEDPDAPIYSFITGRYECRKTTERKERTNPTLLDSTIEPSTVITLLVERSNGGEMIEYHSEAAEFWKQREYKGLEAHVGKNEVRAAVMGQTGIASNYGDK
jgi:diphthamide synthase subunit DPH2